MSPPLIELLAASQRLPSTQQSSSVLQLPLLSVSDTSLIALIVQTQTSASQWLQVTRCAGDGDPGMGRAVDCPASSRAVS